MMWYLSTVIGSKTVTFGSFPQSLRSPPCHGSSIFPTRLQASRGQVSFAVCVIHGSCWLWHLMKRWFTNLWVWMMPETRPLYIDAELNLGDRVWGEGGKGSFIGLPGKGGHSRLTSSKPYILTWIYETVKSFILIVLSRCGQLVDILLMHWCWGK